MGDTVGPRSYIKPVYPTCKFSTLPTNHMIPPLPDSDPDPTTQIPWPAARGKLQADSTTHATVSDDDPGQPSEVRAKPVAGKRRLSTWDLITLSISMAGAQIAWTVELG